MSTGHVMNRSSWSTPTDCSPLNKCVQNFIVQGPHQSRKTKNNRQAQQQPGTTTRCLKRRRNCSPSYKELFHWSKRFVLSHLCGLPKTHEKKLEICPMLSVTGTYNYKLPKWPDNNLKPLSVNEQTVSVILFANDSIRWRSAISTF